MLVLANDAVFFNCSENKVPTDQVGHIEPKKLATSHVNGLRSVSGRQLNQSHTGKGTG